MEELHVTATNNFFLKLETRSASAYPSAYFGAVTLNFATAVSRSRKDRKERLGTTIFDKIDGKFRPP